MSKGVGEMVRSRSVQVKASAGTEGARRATGVPADGAAGEAGPLAPGQRWNVGRKRDVVLRLLRGESLEALSREVGVEIYRLEDWRDRAVAGLERGLQARQGDLVAEALDAAKRHIGELSMENELLRERARAAEQRRPHESLGEVGIDAPVACLVGVGQRRSRDTGTQPDVIQRGLHCAETRFNVAQALSIGELGERQAEELIPTREARCLVLPAIAGHALLELVARHMVHQLREDGASWRHVAFCRRRAPAAENGPWQKISKNPTTQAISFTASDLQRPRDPMTGH